MVAVGLGLAQTVVVVNAAGGDFDWDNGGISGNNLGMLGVACSKFCHAGVSGLDLWLSFKDVSGRDKYS